MSKYEHKFSKTTSDFDDDSLFPSRVASADDESSSNIEEAPNTADMPLADRGKFVTNSHSCPPPVHYATRREQCQILAKHEKARVVEGLITVDEAKQKIEKNYHVECPTGRGVYDVEKCSTDKCMTHDDYYMELSSKKNPDLENGNVCPTEYKLHRHIRGKQITGFSPKGCRLGLQVDGRNTEIIGEKAPENSDPEVLLNVSDHIPTTGVFHVGDCVFQAMLNPFNVCHLNSRIHNGEVCPVDGCRFYGGNCIPKT